jgi:hypothetical protein
MGGVLCLGKSIHDLLDTLNQSPDNKLATADPVASSLALINDNLNIDMHIHQMQRHPGVSFC